VSWQIRCNDALQPEHSKGVTCVQQRRPTFPNDLTEVVDAWEKLPSAVKAGILAMVHATRQKCAIWLAEASLGARPRSIYRADGLPGEERPDMSAANRLEVIAGLIALQQRLGSGTPPAHLQADIDRLPAEFMSTRL
jgi:hypothetical protein